MSKKKPVSDTTFIDVRSGDPFGPDECEDSGGRDLAGHDDMGWWWGIEEAAWLLSQQWYTVEVLGIMHGEDYYGHFIGTVDEAREYCGRHGVTVLFVTSGEDGQCVDDATGELVAYSHG